MTRGCENAVMFDCVENPDFCAEGFNDLIRGGQRTLRCSLQWREQERRGVIQSPFGVGEGEFFLAADGMSADRVEAFGEAGHRIYDLLFRGTEV